MASASPAASTSTRPSGRLRAWPRRPSRCACSRVEARKNTPCTLPLIRKRAAAIAQPSTGAAASTAGPPAARSEEHPSELQSLMRNSYAVFGLKKKKYIDQNRVVSTISILHTQHPHSSSILLQKQL